MLFLDIRRYRILVLWIYYMYQMFYFWFWDSLCWVSCTNRIFKIMPKYQTYDDSLLQAKEKKIATYIKHILTSYTRMPAPKQYRNLVLTLKTHRVVLTLKSERIREKRKTTIQKIYVCTGGYTWIHVHIYECTHTHTHTHRERKIRTEREGERERKWREYIFVNTRKIYRCQSFSWIINSNRTQTLE